MPKVWADSEEVVFNEGIPDDPKQIYELLMGALAEQARAVIVFEVDGVDVLQSGDFPNSFEEIKASSMTHREITFRLCKQYIAQLEKLDTELEAYSSNILSAPWSEVFKQMDTFIGKIQPFAELIDNTTPYAKTYTPPWAEKLFQIAERQAKCLSGVLTSFEGGNPAGVSDELASQVIPLCQKTIKFYQDEIIPCLEKEVTNEQVTAG